MTVTNENDEAYANAVFIDNSEEIVADWIKKAERFRACSKALRFFNPICNYFFRIVYEDCISICFVIFVCNCHFNKHRYGQNKAELILSCQRKN